MSRLQDFLRRACRELGLIIVTPFSLYLRDGVRIDAIALLPQLGAQKGMIVLGDVSDLSELASDIVSMGYGYSIMGEPAPSEEFDLESFRDVFLDWGWVAVPGQEKPRWMN